MATYCDHQTKNSHLSPFPLNPYDFVPLTRHINVCVYTPNDFSLRVRGHQLKTGVQEAASFCKTLNCAEDVDRLTACLEYQASLLALVASGTEARLYKMQL